MFNYYLQLCSVFNTNRFKRLITITKTYSVEIKQLQMLKTKEWNMLIWLGRSEFFPLIYFHLFYWFLVDWKNWSWKMRTALSVNELVLFYPLSSILLVHPWTLWNKMRMLWSSSVQLFLWLSFYLINTLSTVLGITLKKSFGDGAFIIKWLLQKVAQPWIQSVKLWIDVP